MGHIAVLLAVLVLSTAPAGAQDLYKCKMPDGRTVVSNMPCAEGAKETVIDSAGPTTLPAPERPTSVPLPSVVPPPSQPTKCLEILSLDYKILGQRSTYTEVSWQVTLFNRCPQQLQPWVTFSFLDKEGFELDSHMARGFVNGHDEGKARGVFLIRTSLFARVETQRAVARP